jgi:hypothetical protein
MEDLFNDGKRRPIRFKRLAGINSFALPDERVKITFLPVRHWARRGLLDMNKRLWGAYVVEGAGKTVYFGGIPVTVRIIKNWRKFSRESIISSSASALTARAGL